MLISEANIQIEQIKHLLINNMLKQGDEFQNIVMSEIELLVIGKQIKFHVELFNMPNKNNEIDVLLTALFSAIVTDSLTIEMLLPYKHTYELLFNEDIAVNKSIWQILKEKKKFI